MVPLALFHLCIGKGRIPPRVVEMLGYYYLKPVCQDIGICSV